jgi:ketosteroid isomerase-like protein
MPERRLDVERVAAALAEAEAVAILHRLNADYVSAFARSHTAWYSEHLGEDFVCRVADGRRINKSEFLQRLGEGPTVSHVTCDEVDVRPLVDVALVHGITHYTRDGARTSARYTHVWQLRQGRWLVVAAQQPRVTNP